MVELESYRPLIYEDVLLAVGRRLSLQPGSLSIFGLFLGPLGRPTKLCEISQVVSEYVRELSFQRLSFHQEKERSIIKEDEKALELIFWEFVKYRQTMAISLDNAEVEHISDAAKLMSEVESAWSRGQGCHGLMMNFMEYMLSLRYYYWFSFYHAMNCTLQDSFVAINTLCPKGQKMHVFLNKTTLSCLILGPPCEYLNIPWSAVHLVKKNKSKQLFEVQLQSQYHCFKLITIGIQTEQCDYVYSIAVYIIGLQEKLLSQIDLVQPHNLSKMEVLALDRIRPPFMSDLTNFISMLLPLRFHNYLDSKMYSSSSSNGSQSSDSTIYSPELDAANVPQTSSLETWFSQRNLNIPGAHDHEIALSISKVLSGETNEEIPKLPVPHDANEEMFKNKQYNENIIISISKVEEHQATLADQKASQEQIKSQETTGFLAHLTKSPKTEEEIESRGKSYEVCRSKTESRDQSHEEFEAKVIEESTLSKIPESGLDESKSFELVKKCSMSTHEGCCLFQGSHGILAVEDSFYRIVTIHTFFISYKVPITPCRVTVREFKMFAREFLDLSQKAFAIMGLFLGSLTCPTKLLLDSDVLPKYTSEFCLRRLSFEKSAEEMVTLLDDQARNLIYWEARYMCETHRIKPKQNRWISKLNLLLALPNKTNFLEHIRKTLPLFWWSYYYRADDCVVEYDGNVASIVLDKENLIVLHPTGKLRFSCPWDFITCILKRRGTVKFDLLRDHGGSDPSLYTISFMTEHYEYVYSMVAFIFQCRELKFKTSCHPQEKKYINRSFRGTGYNEVGGTIEDLQCLMNQTFKIPK